MTATLDILTPDEFNRLSAAFDAAAGQNQDNLGVWAPAYNLLYDFLSAKSSAVPVDKTTLLWISGARFVNPAIGLFGALIRDYTKAQFLQRYGKPLSDAQANLASNSIAEAFIGQWLGKLA